VNECLVPFVGSYKLVLLERVEVLCYPAYPTNERARTTRSSLYKDHARGEEGGRVGLGDRRNCKEGGRWRGSAPTARRWRVEGGGARNALRDVLGQSRPRSNQPNLSQRLGGESNSMYHAVASDMTNLGSIGYRVRCPISFHEVAVDADAKNSWLSQIQESRAMVQRIKHK
jgi:hypothetical protein